MATEYKLSYTATEIDEKLGKVDSLVSTINGIAPDENGNVELSLLDDPSTEEWTFYLANGDIVKKKVVVL